MQNCCRPPCSVNQHRYAVLGDRIAEISRELGGGGGRPDAAAIAKPKRTMSADTRCRIGAAQRKRRAEAKAATGTSAKKRNLSAAGREAIAEATRKRWAAYRAEKAARAK
jgi:hypothetical protein